MNIWRILVVAILGTLLAVFGWTSQRTATMADRHPTRAEFEQVQKDIRTNQNVIENKLDKIYDHLIK